MRANVRTLISLYHKRVQSAAYTGAAVLFLPSLIASTLLGGLFSAVLVEPIASVTGNAFFGINLGFGLGIAVGTAALTGLAANLSVRLFVKPETPTSCD